MIIGLDLDGIITKAGLWNPSFRLPWWLFILLVPLVFLLKPNKKIVEELKSFKMEGWIIVIISARPKQVKCLTEKYLRFHKVPFSKVVCVGFGKGTRERKLRAIKREKVVFFVDDNDRIISFLRERGVRAINKLKGVTYV